MTDRPEPMTSDPGATPLRDRLRAALTTAMKARDRVAMEALRSTLAALDNAEAVEPAAAPAATSDVIAGAVTGLGAGEVTRRELTEREAVEIVGAEIREREDAADEYERAGRPDRADALRTGAALLGGHLT